MRVRTLQYGAVEHVGTVKVGDELGAAANFFLGLDLRRAICRPRNRQSCSCHYPPRKRFGGAEHGLDDFFVAGAAAKISGQGASNVGF